MGRVAVGREPTVNRERAQLLIHTAEALIYLPWALAKMAWEQATVRP